VTARKMQRTALVAALALLSTGSLAGCDQAIGGDDEAVLGGGSSSEQSPTPATFAANVKARKDVPVDHLVKLRADNGRIREARLTVADGGGKVPGSIVRDGAAWEAESLLEPGTTYRLTAVAESDSGATTKFARTFSTVDLTLDEQTYPSIAPLDGQTVGVGMPVILRFDLPVQNKKAFEKRLTVKTAPVQQGSWHWISDTEVHWRPKQYWKPGTDVTVRADVNSVHAGNGIYGQEDRVTRFSVGDAIRMKIHVPSHTMRVTRNGELLRTIPISAGKPGFTTRSGIKVIVEKHRYKDMTSASIGIADEASADFYDLENVEYAQRVTYSGEFIHAAPWSVGSQGSANVSHGCVGMSTSDAGWLYSVTSVGDVVEVTGTDRHMDLTNGYGDWNLSWADYREGSALS
jgi:lipoprotein-anchoring transpeptidase ErfK/SrfK